jgi:hypothetical protein
MSGRGKRGNRSNDQKRDGFGHGNGKPKPNPKKSVEDYVFYLGSSKQASDYETTAEYLINYIQVTFDYGEDIAESLYTLEEVDLSVHKPKLQVSSNKDAAQRDAENRQYEIEFKEDFAQYKRREEAYLKNQSKAFAFLIEHCSKGMKEKIQSRSDYNVNIKNKPRELLKAIKQHALNFEESRYDMAIVYDAFKTMYSTVQKEGESLQDYTKRFRVAKEVLESHIGGPLILSKIAKSMPNYKDSDAKRALCEKSAYERYMAYVYLKNADQGKYGSLLTGLSTQKSLGNDQYPKSISDATSVLSNHPFDNHKNKNNSPKPQETKNKTGDEEVKLSFAQAATVCYCCGKPNHKSNVCRQKDKIPKEEWAVNKNLEIKRHAQAHFQSEKNESTGAIAEGNKNEVTAKTQKVQSWAGVHFNFHQGDDDMRNIILLDNQSTATVFCNEEMVENIRETNDTLHLSTNGGVLVSNLKANIPGWGVAWFNPKAVTNIFSFAEMKDRYKIDYSNEEDAFIVHLPHRDVKFTRNNIGLYTYRPVLRDSRKQDMQFVTTLEENKTFYTPRQFERAKMARDLYHAIGTPSIEDFKAIIRINAIRNNPVTIDDIKLAEKIFGPDIGTLKGKTTRRKPVPVISDYIEIPRELVEAQREVTLCIDAMKVNGMWFLTTISRNIYYRTAQYVESQTVNCYREALREIIQVYNRAGFQVRRIHCDNEFANIMDELVNGDELDIEINYANPQEHVPEAERNNRVLKERVRAVYHRIPYDRLPRVLVIMMVTETARKLNFFPAKYGVSKYYSPRMIMHQQNLDYDKHCKFSFGTYVQAHDEPQPSNTQQARTLDCIYLRPTANTQGGHECFHIPTNRTIIRRRVTPIPITPSVIKEVETLAESQNMPKGLKIQNKSGHVLFDSTWLAGVEYDEEEFDDDDYSEEHDANQDTDDDELDRDEYEDEDYDIDDPNQLEENHNDEDDQDGNEHENNENVQEQNEENQNPNPDNIENDHDDNVDKDIDNQQENIQELEAAVDDVQDENEDLNENEEPELNEEIEEVNERPRRERVPNRFIYDGSYVFEQGRIDDSRAEKVEYSYVNGKILAMAMHQMSLKFSGITTVGNCNVQTFSLKQGIRKFGERGKQAAMKELRQLHDRVVFEPVDVSKLTSDDKRKAMESLIFLAEKRDGTIKGRACANGSIQRSYIGKDDAASPTVGTEAILITGVIDAKEKRDVMTADIPNAFVQTEVDPEDGIILMKIRGAMVDYLLEIDNQRYRDYVTVEDNKKILYVRMVKALYGMLKSSLLYYKKFRKDIEEIGFKVNPYDPCVANRIVNGKQHTIVWHVDDLKSSHVDPEVNRKFLVWLNKKYADDGIAEVKATFGKVHDYLGMTLDFTEDGILKVDMKDYIDGMIEEFTENVKVERTCPWTEKLFKIDKTSHDLDRKRAEEFHTFVAKGLFLCKRGRPDIQPVISFLSTRVRNPNQNDWEKLKRMMEFLWTTRNDVLKLSVDDLSTIQWYLDAAFAVHPDMKSHTGSNMTLGRGCIVSICTKQKTNSRSSTEAELISLDDILSKVLWTRRFIEAQGIKVTMNVIYRDNTSSMKLEEGGRQSCGKRTRHFDIKYFYITDLIKRKEVSIQYRPTNEMIADYMTKPLTGAKFHTFRKAIMGN